METRERKDGKEAVRSQKFQGTLEEKTPRAVTTVEEMGTLPEIAASQRKDARKGSDTGQNTRWGRCQAFFRHQPGGPRTTNLVDGQWTSTTEKHQ